MRGGHDAHSGLEGAPDIMLLTMAALMVAIVWLVSQVDERVLPEIDLPASDAAALGSGDAASAQLSLRPSADGQTRVWLGERALEGGLGSLEEALAALQPSAVTLRADAATPWQDALAAMTAAARAGLPVSVAADAGVRP